jgi:aspartyl-tRNA(Asn)/glutamyl-tRNA(Gln) amidotransferase subunit A
MTAPHLLTISELSPRLAARQISPVELTTDCLEAIARRNPELNAFITVLADQALAEARRAGEEIAAGHLRGPLHGVPISVKDLIAIAGVPNTAASRVRAQVVAPRDATVVTRLRRAGAIVIGTCNLHEFAFGTTGEDSAFGPTRHPHDSSRSPGGSSSGSAVSVATGMACASIGTDTGGSIRIPAAACGCVGLKPTCGEIPCDGIVPLSRSLDHVGPIARSVRDGWLVYEAMRGSSRSASVTALANPPRGPVRLGLLRPYFMDVLDDDVRAQFEAALARLRSARVRIEAARVPHAADTPAVYLHLQLPEATAYHAAELDRRPDDYQPGVRLRLELGRYVLAEDYVRALRGRAVLRREVDAALSGVHALITPTLPVVATPLGATTVDTGGTSEPVRNATLRLTQLFDVTGHPAITLPAEPAPSGLPCGVQVVGALGRTEALLQLATACEPQITPRT